MKTPDEHADEHAVEGDWVEEGEGENLWEARKGGSEAEEWPAADWQELADYLSGEAPPAAIKATRKRLQRDAHFARLAAPLLYIWKIPLPGSLVDLDAAWEAIQRKAAALRLIGEI